MSAREALFWALWDNYTTAQKNEFIDAFAHELADAIRDRRTRNEANSIPGDVDAMRYRAGLTDAAYIAEGIFPGADATEEH